MMAMVNMVQPIDTIATVYNFEVEKTHNYYVGTEGVLVHNDCLFGDLRKYARRGAAQITEVKDFIAKLRGFTEAEREAFYKAYKDKIDNEEEFAKFIKSVNGASPDELAGIVRDAKKLDNWIALKVKPQVTKAVLAARLANYPNLQGWLSRLDDVQDAALLQKINNLANTDPTKIGKLDELYSRTFRKPGAEYIISTNPDGSFKAKTRNGLYDVEYDKNHFPEFEDYTPGKDHYYISDDLKGNGTTTDFTKANQELNMRFPNTTQIDGQSIKILDQQGKWVTHTWHHHQDGKTLMPVISDVHNFTAHTGGTAIITRGLQNIFSSPY